VCELLPASYYLILMCSHQLCILWRWTDNRTNETSLCSCVLYMAISKFVLFPDVVERTEQADIVTKPLRLAFVPFSVFVVHSVVFNVFSFPLLYYFIPGRFVRVCSICSDRIRRPVHTLYLNMAP